MLCGLFLWVCAAAGANGKLSHRATKAAQPASHTDADDGWQAAGRATLALGKTAFFVGCLSFIVNIFCVSLDATETIVTSVAFCGLALVVACAVIAAIIAIQAVRERRKPY